MARRGMARVAKPVARPAAPAVPREAAKPTRSPNMISSRVVPDLHGKILARIRARRGRQVRVEERCPASPAAGAEVERYLASVFGICDSYSTGTVRASCLLAYLRSLVDLPQLDRWRLEELGRLLDPRQDDRYVDAATWAQVGQAWVEMMLELASAGQATPPRAAEMVEEREERRETDTSFGSVEGVGGAPGCEGREVELELRVAELQHQVALVARERTGLAAAVAVSEEQTAAMAAELAAVRREGEARRREVVAVDPGADEQLATKVEELEKERVVHQREVRRLEALLAEGRREVGESKEGEEVARRQLEAKVQECRRLHRELEVTSQQEEGRQDQEVAVELQEQEMLRQEIQRLQQELSMKDEEVARLATTTATDHQPTSPPAGSPRSNLSSSLIHDMSVDDRVLEEVLVASPRPLQITPSRRGPSASSTPQKESIGDELRGLAASPGLPSPFCEKVEEEHSLVCPKVRLLRLQEGLAERMRRLVAGGREEGRQQAAAMATVNQAFARYRAETQGVLEVLSEEAVPRARCEDKGGCSEAREEVEAAEGQVAGVVELLREANEQLLGARGSPECSVEGEEDLSSWQLDLEGIQLVERGRPLGRRLAQYSVLGRREGGVEEGRREVGMGRNKEGSTFLPLHRGLEELAGQAERSRDLLMLASDSVRVEASMASIILHNTSRLARPATPLQEVQEEEVASPCTEVGCFCGAEEEKSWWGSIVACSLLLLVVLATFTFACGVELEEQRYFPATWHLLRWVWLFYGLRSQDAHSTMFCC